MPTVGDGADNAYAETGLNYGNQVAVSLVMPQNGWLITEHIDMGGWTQNPWSAGALWASNGVLIWGSPGFSAGVGRSGHALAMPNIRISGGATFLLGFWRDPNSDAIWGLDSAQPTNWQAGTAITGGPVNFSNNVGAFAGGQLTAWCDYVANAGPNAGAWQSPTPSGTISDTNPTFSGTTPQNPADSAYDSVSQVRWIITRTDTNQNVFDRTWSINAAVGSWTHTTADFGFGLSAGVPYSATFAYADSWGAWSGWSAGQTFTINSGPNAPTTSAPSGKINQITGVSFTANYTHGSSLASQNVQVQVLDSTGSSVLYDSGTVAKVVSSGSNYTVSQWFSTLGWGTRYQWWTRAQDNTGVWGPWSAKAPFNTDNYPSVPVPQSPTTGSIIPGGAVTLTATFSDPDNDNLTSLLWDLWDTYLNQQVAGYPATVVGTFPSGSQQSRTVTSALLNGHSYKWRVSASDGTLAGTSCAWQTFVYAAAPTVSILQPTPSQVETDSTATISITYSGQPKAYDRTFIYDTTGGGNALAFDSGNIAGGRSIWTLPYATLINGHSYSVTVTVTDLNGLTATSSPVAFTASWTVGTSPILQLLVNGADMTQYLEQDSWRLSQQWGRQADTATFYLDDEHATATPTFVVKPVSSVELRDRNTGAQLFGGVALTPKFYRLSPNLSQWVLSCVSPATYLQNRSVSYDYTNQTADFIVRDLIANAAPIGITTNHVMAGPNIARFQGQNVTVKDALTKLCQLSSVTATFGWWVDGNSDLHFGSDLQYQAVPSGITLTDAVTGTPTATKGYYSNESTYYEWDASSLRTRVLVQGSTITRQTTENFRGDGVTRSWRLSYPYQTNPEFVEVVHNGNQEPAASHSGSTTPWILIQGASGVWSLSIQPGAAPPGSGDTINITYNYVTPVVALVQSGAGITSVNGPNGGYWDTVITDTTLNDLSAAQARGQREVQEFAFANERANLRTIENWVGWLNVGQVFQLVNSIIPDSHNNWVAGINASYLVVQMSASGVGGGWRYQQLMAVRI